MTRYSNVFPLNNSISPIRSSPFYDPAIVPESLLNDVTNQMPRRSNELTSFFEPILPSSGNVRSYVSRTLDDDEDDGIRVIIDKSVLRKCLNATPL